MAPKAKAATVEVRAFHSKGYRANVDAEKYNAMKAALLAALPSKAPGLTQSEMFAAVRPRVSKALFPGTKHMWWVKCVQLDLEARGGMKREDGAKPMRWHKVK
jgi:hypothetical protein